MTDSQINTRADILANLREMMPPGSTVYTILRHKSANGMSRRISVIVIEDGEIRQPDYMAAEALGLRMHPTQEGIVVKGCGMDMGFHLVHSLSSALYGDGFALKHRWL